MVIVLADMSEMFDRVGHVHMLPHLDDIGLCPEVTPESTQGGVTVFGNRKDIGYADDIGLSQAIPSTNTGDTSVAIEAQQLGKWSASNNTLINEG